MLVKYTFGLCDAINIQFYQENQINSIFKFQDALFEYYYLDWSLKAEF